MNVATRMTGRQRRLQCLWLPNNANSLLSVATLKHVLVAQKDKHVNLTTMTEPALGN